MSFEAAALMTSRLLAFALLLQGLEGLLVSRNVVFQKVWSLQNLKADLRRGLPLPGSFIDALFSARSFRLILTFQVIAAGLALVFPSALLFSLLFFTHLLICIRFRGTFNGGSDMMTFVLLTGVLMTSLATTAEASRLGLIYIAIHGLYSYVKAGIAKIRHRDWRTGQSLPAFLSRSLYPDIRRLGAWLQTKPGLLFIGGWLVLVFELSVALLIFAPGLGGAYFATAVLFHFTIYASFGLNRFFWIWIGAWPAILYSLSLL